MVPILAAGFSGVAIVSPSLIHLPINTSSRRCSGCGPDPSRSHVPIRACSVIEASFLPTQYEVGDLLRLVDLDVVAAVVEEMQLAVGEQFRELSGDPGVELPVARPEDHPYQRGEAAKLGDAPPAGQYRAKQVVVEPPESRPSGQGLLVQMGNELVAYLRILDELADLPGIQASVHVGSPANQSAGAGADQGRGVEGDRGWAAQARGPVVGRVEQHQIRTSSGIVQRPVDRWRAGGVVRDQRDLAGVDVFVDGGDDGCQVTEPTCRRVWIALWVIPGV